MKIILIFPQCDLEDRYSNKVKIDRGYLPPLGLAYLGTVLEENNHSVKILDLQVNNLSLDEICEFVKEFKPDVVGISVLVNIYNKGIEIAKHLKDKLGVKIIIGGPHASCIPQKILKENDFVDFVIVGEGEYSFLELINSSFNKDIKGVYSRENGNLIFAGLREIIEDLDQIPIPRRDFFEMEKYIPLPNQYNILPITNMITGRGCGYGKCTFCFEAGRLGHKYRRISPQRAIEEIKYLIKEYKIKEISFWDDEFVIGNKWVNEFCDLLKSENIEIRWSCYARVNYVNQEILKKMASSGCWNIFYGLESGNQELLDKINKNITLEQSRNAVRWAQEAGIQVRGSFMLALPGETLEMANKTIDFALDLDLDYVQFLFTTPYPGTKLYDQCKEEGKIINENLNDYSVFKVVFLPKGYNSVDELIRIQKEAYRKFYFRPKYIIKHIKRVKNFNDIKKYWLGLKFAIGMSR
ncbi:MAG TPA: radical SAM protein [Candidatus Nanoarchaeia archaeon]|nr:radical SAM protein [Candidatus Nanoarchaeia archaeon]